MWACGMTMCNHMLPTILLLCVVGQQLCAEIKVCAIALDCQCAAMQHNIRIDQQTSKNSRRSTRRVCAAARAERHHCSAMQDGPIHDAQWSPDGDFFVVVAGFMPAKTVLFDAKCKPVFDLGTGPYNIIRWNPQVAFHSYNHDRR